MTIFIHELKAFRKNTLLWTVSLLALISMFLWAFPAYSESAEELKKLFTGFPPELMKAIGLDINLIFSILGYYSFVFTYVMLCGSIQAMFLGTSLIAKEFNRKTADFLFTKPVSRPVILTGKLLSGVVSLLLTDAIFISGAYVSVLVNNDGQALESRLFFMISVTLFFVQMMFYTLGILAGVFFQRIKSVLGVSLGTVFGFFVAGMLGSALHEEKIRYLVPFQYYEPIKIINESAYDMTSVWINLLFVVLAIALSYVIYVKKDIHAV